jgi:hypothetical protein
VTDGVEALREAARLEAARVYGTCCPEHHSPQGDPQPLWMADSAIEQAFGSGSLGAPGTPAETSAPDDLLATPITAEEASR